MGTKQDLQTRLATLRRDLPGIERMLTIAGKNASACLAEMTGEIRKLEAQLEQIDGLVGDERERESGGVEWRRMRGASEVAGAPIATTVNRESDDQDPLDVIGDPSDAQWSRDPRDARAHEGRVVVIDTVAQPMPDEDADERREV